MSCGHCILKTDLTINDATYKSVDVREDDRSVLLKLLPMLGILLVCGKIYAPKLGLDNKAPLMRWKSNVYFDGVFNSIRIVDFLEELLLVAPKADVVKLSSSSQYR